MISHSKQTVTREITAAIRGRMISLTVLELFGNNLDELNRQLREKAAQAPSFFQNAPLLLDFEQFDAELDITWLDNVCQLLIDNDFVLVGITGANQLLEDAARVRGIAIWPSGGTVRKETEEKQPIPEKAQTVTSPAPVHSVTQVVQQPIRSGQRVYAQGGDLIVLASVSAGAEVLADGHIHVYGSLRGRALAGIQGNENARIFCHDLQADLIAIAGIYMISDDLPAGKRNKAVQIYLHQEQLQIEPI